MNRAHEEVGASLRPRRNLRKKKTGRARPYLDILETNQILFSDIEFPNLDSDGLSVTFRPHSSYYIVSKYEVTWCKEQHGILQLCMHSTCA
jgi:hypothetical protein